MAQQKKLNIDVNNGKVFYCDEISVIHNPLKIFIDFRNTTPRVDVRNNEFQPLVIEHNVVLMDPFLAKQLLKVLEENLKNYEKTFGEIKEPEALKKVKKDAHLNKAEITDNIHPTYFG